MNLNSQIPELADNTFLFLPYPFCGSKVNSIELIDFSLINIMKKYHHKIPDYSANLRTVIYELLFSVHYFQINIQLLEINFNDDVNR